MLMTIGYMWVEAVWDREELMHTKVLIWLLFGSKCGMMSVAIGNIES